MQTPAVPSPVVRRVIAAYHMATFLDDLVAAIKTAQIERMREADGSDTGEFEAVQ
jgi:hypothetical protein